MKFVLFIVSIIVLMQTNSTLARKSDKQCDKYIYITRETRAKRSSGKYPASTDEFPHMAALLYDNYEPKCGGALISDQFILTSAVCTFDRIAGAVKKVRLGTNNIAEQGVVEDISRIITYPEYAPPKKYHDIALLQLAHKVNLTNSLRPACLQTDANLHTNTVIGTGWGSPFLAEAPSSKLLKVTMDVFTNEECKKAYSANSQLVNGITDNMLCSGGRSELKGTCKRDGGGPLQILRKNHKDIYNIVGVISFGRSCGILSQPEVATRVSSYIPWIENIVWP